MFWFHSVAIPQVFWFNTEGGIAMFNDCLNAKSLTDFDKSWRVSIRQLCLNIFFSNPTDFKSAAGR